MTNVAWGDPNTWVWGKSGMCVTGWVLGGKGTRGTVCTRYSEKQEAAAQQLGGNWGLIHQVRLWRGWDFEILYGIGHNVSVESSSVCRAILPAFTCYLLGTYKATGKMTGRNNR